MVEVRRSTVIDAPVDAVWSILSDFSAHDRWHPAVLSSRMDAGMAPNAVGAIRNLEITDGAHVREQLLARSDDEHSVTYCILECTLPLIGYVATITLKPVTDGNRTFWEWRSEFQPPASRRSELVTLVGDGIYAAGFRAVTEALRTGRPRPARALERSPQPTSRPTTRPARVETGTDAATIVMDRHGGPEVLRLQTVKVPPPQAGEVRIRQSAIGVNFVDVYARSGYFDHIRPSGTPGLEAVGVIESVGAGVAEFEPGDRVAYACPPAGAYTALRVMPPELLIPLPAFLSDAQGAAILLKGITASFLLHEVYPPKPEDTILIHAAAGGVGQLLCQWASALGARVIGTVSTEDKAQRALRAGCAHVINYAEHDFADAVMEFTSNRGADAVFDAVGRDTFEKSLQSLTVRGTLVSFGQASGDIGARDIGSLASKSVTLVRPNYGHYTGTRAAVRAHADRLFAAIADGILHIDNPAEYALADAAQAHADLEDRLTIGAVILRP